jgi:hypothetical protein
MREEKGVIMGNGNILQKSVVDEEIYNTNEWCG